MLVVEKVSPGIITISSTTGIHTWALDLAKKIKSQFNIPIMLGGHHPTFFPEVINDPNIDMICVGEGELAITELLDRFNSDITKVPGIYVKKNGVVYKNDVAHNIDNLDDLPFPDRNLYCRYPFITNQENLRIITMRGCPYRCSFCFHPAMRRIYDGKGKYVRRRSVANVIEELKLLKGKYKRVDFQDDTFIVNFNSFVKPFLEAYSKEIALPFTCCVRADIMTEEVVVALKNAHCHSVKMGIETADDNLNNTVLKRDLNLKQVEDAINLCKKHGVKVETFNLIGIPGETIEQALKTMQFNSDMGVDFARCALVQPYPKTDLEEYCKEHDFLEINFDINSFENSYFVDSPMKLNNKNQFINLERLFGVGVRFKFLIPIIKLLIKLPPNALFDWIFRVDYALSIKSIDKVSTKDFINFSARAIGFFSKKK